MGVYAHLGCFCRRCVSYSHGHKAQLVSVALLSQVKDIMAHLYFKAKETAARDQPPEVRILKHLLTMDDPMERNEALGMAFEPGTEAAGEKDVDVLHTCVETNPP